MSSLLMRFSRDPILDFFLPLVNQISSLCDARLPILYYIWPPIHLSGLLAIDYLRPSKTFPAPHHLQFAESLSRIFYVSETEKEGQITSEEVSSDYLFTFCFIRNKAWLDSWRASTLSLSLSLSLIHRKFRTWLYHKCVILFLGKSHSDDISFYIGRICT